MIWLSILILLSSMEILRFYKDLLVSILASLTAAASNSYKSSPPVSIWLLSFIIIFS